MILSAYLDESELSAMGVFAIAGYVFNPDDCKRFERQWQSALASVRPPLRRFHMSEFENRQGPYALWPDKFRHQFLNRLITAISNTRLLVSAAIDLHAFASLSDENLRLLNNPTPYRFCFEVCLKGVIDWLNEGGHNERVAYVLDNVGRDKGKGKLQSEFIQVNSNPGEYDFFRIASLTWMDSAKVPELQAADILVYETAKEAAHKVGHSDREPRKSAMQLLRGTTASNRKSIMIDQQFIDRLLARPEAIQHDFVVS